MTEHRAPVIEWKLEFRLQPVSVRLKAELQLQFRWQNEECAEASLMPVTNWRESVVTAVRQEV
jgi:hypothetical protein